MDEMSFIKEFDHLRIQLKDIMLATDNFSRKKLIGRGGFGPVYKGELSKPEGQMMVAFKRLDRKFGQGDERILVYEYVCNGSLDHYLSDTNLKWAQRIKISIGIAHALSYLHDPMETQHRVLHRDVKSSNILLDEKWCAKVSDFGLSKVGPANQTRTYLFSNAVGTVGYCDPLYWEMGFLSKESDVYSFGVVLFEIMCGKLCCEYLNGKLVSIFVHTWRKCCDEKRLDDIIFCELKEYINYDSLITFSAIANRCLSKDHEERPTMVEIIKELEVALQQDFYQDVNSLYNIMKLVVPPISYESKDEFLSLFSEGTLVAGCKTWLSINKNYEIREVISATKCISGDLFIDGTVEDSNSRFLNVVKGVMYSGFKAQVSTEFLTPHVTYTINLVFKHNNDQSYVPFKYKLDGETQYLTPYIEYFREDGWLTVELYQFTSSKRKHDFRIEFVQPFQISSSDPVYFVEGIEFWPMEHEIRDLEGKKGDMQPIFKGIPISENTKKCIRIPAKKFLRKEEWKWRSLPESRKFQVVAKSPEKDSFDVVLNSKLSQSLTPQTTYSCHFIYKLPESYSSLDGLVVLLIKSSPRLCGYLRAINLVDASHATPFIGPNKPLYNPKIRGDSKLREDGWMEIQLGEVSTDIWGVIKMYVRFSCNYDKYKIMNFVGLVVQGVEFRLLH